MTTTTDLPRADLAFRSGSSDKVYHAAVEPQGEGFVVTFAYGRRGSTLTTGVKTTQPVGYAAACQVFEKLVREKSAKGYSPGQAGVPYQQTPKEVKFTGILPQLLNSIEPDAVQRLLSDPAWWAQEKFDGRRVLIRRRGDTVIGINRQGLQISLPDPIARQAEVLGGQQWLIDGEAVGDRFLAFDLLEYACIDVRPKPYAKRLQALAAMVSTSVSPAIRLVQTATTTGPKKMLYASLTASRAEGIVFKRQAAPYIPGRPASGGDQLKCKFVATASCLVAGTNSDRRSVSLLMLDGGSPVGVGNVTVPPNQPVPERGSIIEVRYLYAHPGGSLYQPVLIGVRDDLSHADCGIGQLKYRKSDE